MASTIRVRAVASGETTEVQSLIQHPMDSGFVKDAKGDLIPPHYIEVVEFEHGGKTVFTAFWGPAVSKDPYLKFSFKGAQKGDELKVSWVDNKGAPIRSSPRSDNAAGRAGSDGEFEHVAQAHRRNRRVLGCAGRVRSWPPRR